MMTVVATVAGAVCMFVAEGFGIDHVHAYLGMCANLLGWSQPLNALARCPNRGQMTNSCRCGPHDGKRPIFNWVHRLTGMTAWMLACESRACAMTKSSRAAIAIYWATSFDSMGLSVANSGWTPRVLMYVYWATIAIAFISLEVRSKCRVNLKRTPCRF